MQEQSHKRCDPIRSSKRPRVSSRAANVPSERANLSKAAINFVLKRCVTAPGPHTVLLRHVVVQTSLYFGLRLVNLASEYAPQRRRSEPAVAFRCQRKHRDICCQADAGHPVRMRRQSAWQSLTVAMNSSCHKMLKAGNVYMYVEFCGVRILFQSLQCLYPCIVIFVLCMNCPLHFLNILMRIGMV